MNKISIRFTSFISSLVEVCYFAFLAQQLFSTCNSFLMRKGLHVFNEPVERPLWRGGLTALNHPRAEPHRRTSPSSAGNSEQIAMGRSTLLAHTMNKRNRIAARLSPEVGFG